MGVVGRAAVLLFALALGARGALAGQDPGPRTTRDRVYSKEQAARGGDQYVAICSKCHDPAKVPPGKKPGPPLVGDVFLSQWRDRTVGELLTGIQTTMPSDGSVTLSEDQTADLVAYLLQVNGFPDGPGSLKADAPSRDIVIAR